MANVQAPEGSSGSTPLVFTVTLSPTSALPVTVVAQTADGTAQAGSDYTAVGPTTLTFAPGVTTQTFSVPVLGDTLAEPDETFLVSLSTPTNAALGSAQATGTIVNDDAPSVPVAITIEDASAREGNTGTTPATFAVNLSRASQATVTVQYATADGTATAADADYQAASGTLTFNPGEVTKSLTVSVNGDTRVEPDERFVVNLANPTNAEIARSQAVGTIVNEDAPVSTPQSPPATPLLLSVSDLAVNEGDSGSTAAIFTVTLSQSSQSPVTVQYATADGTATAADNDYVPASGTLTFNPGETSRTITVAIKGDTRVEPNETFTIALATPINAVLARGQAVGVIQNDDTAASVGCSPRPAVAQSTRPTGDGRLQVTLTADTQGPNAANRLTALQFPAGTNALLDVGGRSGQAGPLTVPMPDHPTSVTFYVRRAAAGQPMTQPIVVVDSCGEWTTFVGGGPDAW